MRGSCNLVAIIRYLVTEGKRKVPVGLRLSGNRHMFIKALAIQLKHAHDPNF